MRYYINIVIVILHLACVTVLGDTSSAPPVCFRVSEKDNSVEGVWERLTQYRHPHKRATVLTKPFPYLNRLRVGQEKSQLFVLPDGQMYSSFTPFYLPAFFPGGFCWMQVGPAFSATGGTRIYAVPNSNLIPSSQWVSNPDYDLAQFKPMPYKDLHMVKTGVPMSFQEAQRKWRKGDVSCDVSFDPSVALISIYYQSSDHLEKWLYDPSHPIKEVLPVEPDPIRRAALRRLRGNSKPRLLAWRRTRRWKLSLQGGFRVIPKGEGMIVGSQGKLFQIAKDRIEPIASSLPAQLKKNSLVLVNIRAGKGRIAFGWDGKSANPLDVQDKDKKNIEPFVPAKEVDAKIAKAVTVMMTQREKDKKEVAEFRKKQEEERKKKLAK